MRARFDPALEAVVLSSKPLSYADGARVVEDRPAHVRAASSIVRFGARFAIVQDDASFLALVDGDRVESIALPHHVDGARQFDDLRGNKKQKLDLEACVVLDETIVAFGSGSSPLRERILVARPPEVRLVDASSLYASLRARTDFSGSELNVEGATRVEGRVRLFQRGNGAPRGELLPVDATVDLDARALLSFLEGGPVPALLDVVSWELPSIAGVRLGFTDATTVGDRVLFLSAAEASPDAVRDGPCVGVAIGVVDEDGARMARISGLSEKAEGLVLDTDDPRRGYLVVDRDDPSTPSTLVRFELRGPWW